MSPGGRTKCALSRSPSERISSTCSHRRSRVDAGILTRVTTAAQITPPAPALKEWAAIVHALLEGEQIIDLRKGGLREDGRHFEVPARRIWLYPTAEHQRGELLKPAYRHWVDLATAAPIGEAIPIAGWADVVDVATITEAEHLDAIASKLIWTDEYASSRLQWKKRDPLWVLVLRAHRLDEPMTVSWAEGYGGCTSWVTLDGLPPTRPPPVAPGTLRRGIRVEAQGRARVTARRVLAAREAESQQALRVAQQHLFGDRVGHAERGPRSEPLVVGEKRVVGPEQHPVLQRALDVAHEIGSEAARRPARQVDPRVGLVQRDRELLVLPRPRGVRHHDLQFGKSAATASRWIGRDTSSFRLPPPGMPAPRPVVPVCTVTGIPSAVAVS